MKEKELKDQKEFERIVEFSYNSKHQRFVVRFLSGETYSLQIEDLPKKLQTKKPDWDKTRLSKDQSTLLFEAKSEKREIPAYIIHSKGKPLL